MMLQVISANLVVRQYKTLLDVSNKYSTAEVVQQLRSIMSRVGSKDYERLNQIDHLVIYTTDRKLIYK